MLPFKIGHLAIDLADTASQLTLQLSRQLATLPIWHADAESRAETKQTMENAERKTAAAMQAARDTVAAAAGSAHAVLLQNKAVASVVGRDFIGLPMADIKCSLRLDGRDVSVQEVARAFQASGKRKAVLLVHGLFCNEELWAESFDEPDQNPMESAQQAEQSRLERIRSRARALLGSGIPNNILEILEKRQCYPILLRFNPGIHISDNGQELLKILLELLEQPEMQRAKLSVITYSLGGLILRSALYYNAIQKPGPGPLASRLDRAILINSPDGGSWLEKLGFWIAAGLKSTPLPGVTVAGIIGDQRSDGIKDLSHGIIREQDWQTDDQIKRYTAERYFGELDAIDAVQVYSQINVENKLMSVLGDGIVEEGSLSFLSEKVFRKKEQELG
ncbi:MAG: hypothetical protein KDK39_07440, partial [Leptospiraceae bacterium]|nr:hypothetical protein [Leptospiraceae bacterium]